MISAHIPDIHELARLSYGNLMDDRQDYMIEIFKNVIHSDSILVENKVIALNSLGDIYCNYIADLDKAIEFTNKAIELASSTDINFNYILRGDIWKSKLHLLELLEKKQEIEDELEKIINKYKDKEFKSNSYLHNAYKYKANVEYLRGDYKTALDNLMDAQSYYPVKFYAHRLRDIGYPDCKNEFQNLELLLSRNVCKIKDWQM